MERIETSNTEAVEFVRTRSRVLPLECVGELKNDPANRFSHQESLKRTSFNCITPTTDRT